MIKKIKIKRGAEANLSTAGAESGELKYTTDTEKLYIGNGTFVTNATGTFYINTLFATV